MKHYFILFWHGLTGILASIAKWFTVILGMRDDSKYGKFIRRVVGTCFATLMLLLTVATIWIFGQTICHRLNLEWGSSNYIPTYSNESLSRNLWYHNDDNNKGYVFDRDGKKLIKNINWISKPLGNDSLVCYSTGKKRGYFNMYTGEVVVRPKYAHAWVFSDGLASVDDDGWIKFIDQSGKIVLDPKIPYRAGKDGYVFHNDHCVVHNDRGDRLGLIDKEGKWALQPEYFSVNPADSFWIISNGKEQSVLNKELQVVLPFMEARILMTDGLFEATMSDHTIRTYSLKGELVEDFNISDVSQLMYDTSEIYYSNNKYYDDEGNLSSETEDSEALTRSAVARCLCYRTDMECYGLMSPDGHILTPPSYSIIKAIGQDLYLCKTSYDQGIILNGKGQRVK